MIGNGPWGRCLIPSIKKNQPIFWVFRSEEKLDQTRGALNEPGIIYTTEFPLITDRTLLIYAIPSDQLIDHVQSYLPAGINPYILITSKGLCPKTGQVYSSILETLGYDLNKIAFFAGASYAKELDSHTPTLITLASSNQDLYLELKDLLSNQDNVSFEFTPNIIAVQLWSVVKNLAACASGFIYHQNSTLMSDVKCLVLKSILKEFSAYLEDKHGWSLFEHYIFSAGIGDCYLSATSSQSRNYCYGQLLAGDEERKKSLEHTTIEVKNTLQLLEHEDLTLYPSLRSFINLHQKIINADIAYDLLNSQIGEHQFSLSLPATLMTIFFKIQAFQKKNDQAAHLVQSLKHMQMRADHLSIIVSFIDQHHQQHFPCIAYVEKNIIFSTVRSAPLRAELNEKNLPFN